MLPLICNQAESAPYVPCAHTRTRTYIRIYARTLSAIDMCYVRMYTIRLRALMNTQSKFHIYIYLRAVCAYSRESARVKPYVYVSIYNQSYSRIRTYTRVYAGIRAYACMHICMHMRVHAGITHINALTRAVRSRKLR